MREFSTTAAFLLPPSRTKNRILGWLGHTVDRDAHVGINVVLGTTKFEIGRARIGSGNLFRSLDLVHFADGAVMGNFNWVSAAQPFSGTTLTACSLRLENSAAVTSRHGIDCSGGVSVGAFSIVSGAHSDLLTHGIDDGDDVQVCAPITIGRYSRLGSCNKVAPGATLPDRSITALGSVVLPGLTTPGRLYAGVPAADKKAAGGAWFDRLDATTPVRGAGIPTGASR